MKTGLSKLLVLPLALLAVAALAQPGVDVRSSVAFDVAQLEDGSQYVVDENGNALYAYVRDEQGISRCYDDCAAEWVPVRVSSTSELSASEELSEARLGRTSRRDGSMQATFQWWPVYVSANAEPGAAVSDESGEWLLITPEGELLQDALTQAADADAGSDDEVAAVGSLSSGVFTEAQAQRGADVYQQQCAMCHGANLRGTPGGPAIAGGLFDLTWGDQTVGDLYTYVHGNMPPGRAGSLDNQTYVDVVTHILSVNGYPAGDAELTVDHDLDSIVITD